jgi:AraC-like DNA-binding protein
VAVSLSIVRAFVDVIERTGVDRDCLFGAANVDRTRLDTTDGYMALAEFTRLQVGALDLTGDEALGLRIGESAGEAAFDVIGHLVAHAATLREALELAVQFQRVFGDGNELALAESDDAARLRLRLERTGLRARRMFSEFAMAALLRLIRTFAPRAAVRHVYFEHGRPDHHGECARVFGRAVSYGRGETAMVFDRAALDQRGIHHHPELHQLLRPHAERALARATGQTGQAARLRMYLFSHPAIGAEPDMTTVARALGMSVRSLRRRLSEEGVSFTAIREESLAATATQYLARRSIQETAYAMGFSDPTAFHRAFKRWTGMTPTQYREKAQD